MMVSAERVIGMDRKGLPREERTMRRIPARMMTRMVLASMVSAAATATHKRVEVLVGVGY